LLFQAFDINALLKLDQDLSADVSKASCTAEESMLHNTIKSQDGDVEHGKEVQCTLESAFKTYLCPVAGFVVVAVALL